jgi:sirohydrochlorin ferrochelatase
MRYLLVDNGSLRPASILNLRRVARELGRRSGREVLPASLLHSSKVPAAELEGEAAVNFERRLRWSLEAGLRDFRVVPFFFGPTAALTDYLPERIAYRRKKHGDFRIDRLPFLFEREQPEDAGNRILVEILADRVRSVISEQGLDRPRVVLVDHGSPKAAVTAVRDQIAEMLASVLGEDVPAVAPASMERREGEAYAFNEPLLERKLDEPGWDSGDVIVAMLFLSPGRHAGPGGDIAGICATAEHRHPGLRTHMSGLVGDHPRMVDLLEHRLRAGPVAL